MHGMWNPIVVLASVVGLVALTPPPGAAAAGLKAQPITCEMVVQQDANLYLARDLTCPTFAVLVVQRSEPEPGPVPHVTVDLRGHTLWGGGTGTGFTALNFPGYPELEVRNGRLENFAVAVRGDSTVRIRNVRLVDNAVGFACNGYCRVERSLVKGSSEAGIDVGPDADAAVTHTVFERNAVAARVGFVSGLAITASVFTRNGLGVGVEDGSTASVSRSLFLRNRVGVKVTVLDPADGLCVTLNRNAFVRNRTNLVGPRC